MAALTSLQVRTDDAAAPVFFLFRQHVCESSWPNKASLAFILSSSCEEMDQEVDDLAASVRTRPKDRRRRIRIRMCEVDGCTKRAKFHRKCWHHGGSTECKIPGCLNRVKTKGLCWSHGGGTVCSVRTCRTTAVSNGVCWAHGGGKRCQIPDCARSAYGTSDGLCKAHSTLPKGVISVARS